MQEPPQCLISVQSIRWLLYLKPTISFKLILWLFLSCRENSCCFSSSFHLLCIRLTFPILHFLLFLHLSFHSSFILNFPHIYHSLYLCLLALYVCIDFVAVHAPCFSPFLIEGVKWSLSLPNEIKVFFLPLPFLCSLAPLQQAQTPSALNLRVWNELPLLGLSTHLCALSLAHCSPSLILPLTSQVHFSLMHLFVLLPNITLFQRQLTLRSELFSYLLVLAYLSNLLFLPNVTL